MTCPTNDLLHTLYMPCKEWDPPVYGYFNKPLAVHQACPEALCEGLDPVVSQHHRLRQAEVELLLRGQSRTAGPRC